MSLAFFGDGATNIGTFHESMNLAQLWQLPVVFVCENNHWSESTPQSQHQPIRDLTERAAAYGMHALHVDGQDVEAVHLAASRRSSSRVQARGRSFFSARPSVWTATTSVMPRSTATRTSCVGSARRGSDPNLRERLELSETQWPNSTPMRNVPPKVGRVREGGNRPGPRRRAQVRLLARVVMLDSAQFRGEEGRTRKTIEN